MRFALALLLALAAGSADAASLPSVSGTTDPNSQAYQGAVQMTVAGSLLNVPTRAIAANCSAAGTLTLLMNDRTNLYWPVVAGFQFQPFAVIQITASTATCDRYQGLN